MEKDQMPEGMMAKGATAPAREANPMTPEKPAAKLPPELAEKMQRVLLAAMKILYADPKTSQAIVQAVAQAEDPAIGIVDATGMILGQLAERAKGLDPKLLGLVAPAVAALVAELAIKAKAVKDDDQLMARVMQAMQPRQGAQPAQGPQGQGDMAGAMPAQGGGMIEQAMMGG